MSIPTQYHSNPPFDEGVPDTGSGSNVSIPVATKCVTPIPIRAKPAPSTPVYGSQSPMQFSAHSPVVVVAPSGSTVRSGIGTSTQILNHVIQQTADAASIAQHQHHMPLPVGRPRRPAQQGGPSAGRKMCNCTKSMCLKLYCECFSIGEYCVGCKCVNCHNHPDYDAERSNAIKSCIDRNPHAFRPKISQLQMGERKHQKGCQCKKSSCLKNYCECYEAKVKCGPRCKCEGCRNDDDKRHIGRRTAKPLHQLATAEFADGFDELGPVFGIKSGEAQQALAELVSDGLLEQSARILLARAACYENPPQGFQREFTVTELEKDLFVCYEWYEQPSYLVITFKNLPGVKHDHVKCHYGDIQVELTVKRENGADFVCDLALNHPILPEKSKFRVVAAKSVEITLFKAESYTWGKLEGEGIPITVPKGTISQTSTSVVSTYPTSSQKGATNWDKMAKEFEENEQKEKPPGEFNESMKGLYAGMTDEQKRAANKSYYESGGTVLSNNWDEVKTKTVEVRPPDCMEYKKWND